MSKLRKPFRFVPELLTLEERCVPAGNVTAQVFTNYFGEHVLHVYGDAQDNHVKLNGEGILGQVEVKGIDTTINGGTQPVLFQNIDQVWVDTADGNDIVRAENLNVLYAQLLLGGGDDVGEMIGYTRQDSGSLVLSGDGSNIAYPDVNGTDVLTVANTSIHGADSYFTLGLYGDDPEEGNDVVTLKNTDVDISSSNPSDGSYLFGFILDANSGDITINNLDVDLTGPGSMASAAYINGTSGSDHVRFNNVKMTTYTEVATFMDFYVDTLPWMAGPDGGHDLIELNNVDIAMNTPGFAPGGAQLGGSLVADTITMNNVNFHGGESGGSGTFFFMSGQNFDFRNTSITSAGWVTLGISSLGAYGGPADLDTTISFKDVTVAADPRFGSDIHTFLSTEGGADCVTIKNSSLGNTFIDLGAGDDALTLRNNEFGSLEANLGDGNDTADVRHNTASSLFIDGGVGIDVLIALSNVSPTQDFVNFEG